MAALPSPTTISTPRCSTLRPSTTLPAPRPSTSAAARTPVPLPAGQILYALGTSNAPDSYPANPAFAGGVNANGFPKNGAQIELYGVGGRIKNPVSYLYSLETQTQLPSKIVLTVGYGGSLGRHNPRLVNQNFLYNNTESPTYAAYFAADRLHPGLQLAQCPRRPQLSAMASRSKATTPSPRTWTRSPTATAPTPTPTRPTRRTTSPSTAPPTTTRATGSPSRPSTQRPRCIPATSSSKPSPTAGRSNGIFTAHSGFPWTPVTYNLQSNIVPNAAAVVAHPSPRHPLRRRANWPQLLERRLHYRLQLPQPDLDGGTAGTAGGQNYFNTTAPTLPPGQNYVYTPGIGRNSFTGPCYRDVDLSLAKEVQFEGLGHTATLRFQANMFNAFNLLNLSPITNGNARSRRQHPERRLWQSDQRRCRTADRIPHATKLLTWTYRRRSHPLRLSTQRLRSAR